MPSERDKASGDLPGCLALAVGILLILTGFACYVLTEGDGGSAPPPMVETIRARQVAYVLFAVGAAVGVGGLVFLIQRIKRS